MAAELADLKAQVAARTAEMVHLQAAHQAAAARQVLPLHLV